MLKVFLINPPNVGVTYFTERAQPGQMPLKNRMVLRAEASYSAESKFEKNIALLITVTDRHLTESGLEH